MAEFVFRLQGLLDRRIEARRRAEEQLAACERGLAAEKKTMQELEAAADAAEALYQRRRAERSASGRNRGTPFLSQDSALAGLKLDVQAARSAVLSQQIFVDEASEHLEEAHAALAARKQEEDVLEKFREKAKDRFVREESYREELEQDEIGSVMYLSRQSRT
jgi:flagellar biosynthesis chaperone FliJ